MSAPPPAVRLRQVVVITEDLPGATGRLRAELGLAEGYWDEGVGHFGLENRVLAAGDGFVEVLTPLPGDSAGRRYLDRRGRDGGYMAIFQFRDRDEPRRRAAELGLEVVWQADLDDVSGTHLHPRDVPGAIVSLDWADPPDSWHWAGPGWQGAAAASAPERAGGLRSLELAVLEPEAAAARWAEVLGTTAVGDGTEVALVEAGQSITFVESPDRAGEGIVACGLELSPVGTAADVVSTEIAGVLFTVRPLVAAPKEDR